MLDEFLFGIPSQILFDPLLKKRFGQTWIDIQQMLELDRHVVTGNQFFFHKPLGKIKDARHHHALILGMVAQLAVARKHPVAVVSGVFQHRTVSNRKVGYARVICAFTSSTDLSSRLAAFDMVIMLSAKALNTNRSKRDETSFG